MTAYRAMLDAPLGIIAIVVLVGSGGIPAIAMRRICRVGDVGSCMHRHAKQGGDQEQDEDEAAVHI